MLNLFASDVTTNYGSMLTPLHKRLVDISHRNMERALNHWRSNENSILNNHLVVKLIKELPLPGGSLTQLSLDNVRKYYDDLRAVDYRYGNKFNLTSATRFGAIVRSQFYDDSVDEIIITNSEPFKPEMLYNWQDAEPIKVHRHPYNVTYYGLLCKKHDLGGSGVAVLSINIPLLALQYLMWLREQTKDGATAPAPYLFVTKYPIPNLLKSHNDIAIFNRFIGRYENDLRETRNVRQSFWLNDELAITDQVIVRTVVELQRSQRFFEAVLLHIPTVWRNGHDAIRLPIDMEMRQNRWAWIIARTWVIDFLVELEVSFKRRKEGANFNTILHAIQRIRSDNTFYLSGLTSKVKNTIDYELTHIQNMITGKDT
ncbi:hypothetical protein SPECIALG_224 [Erwinia phage vB_EamM_Special G]|uniref:Uncharacterized protein n=1 Tax=Erwinia phage vB_EamM_Special G TaxID=1815989 RepID=A0A191ZCB2_9CAUD|nr:hypothetical protein FDI00_gp223 [Erwinia phage vB_EamM_Special G]ANJ65035.1 hypothetical protein SPECIALG_224 [Erwinia phage vB_EamM_Special G]